jgi:hypothetical protein
MVVRNFPSLESLGFPVNAQREFFPYGRNMIGGGLFNPKIVPIFIKTLAGFGKKKKKKVVKKKKPKTHCF